MLDSVNQYKYITTAATYNLYGTATRRVLVRGIFINKALTGTLTIKSGSTTIGVIAAGTAAGSYWNLPNGTLVESCNITNSSSEDVTVSYANIS